MAPEAGLAYVYDRVCDVCQTRYTPPTPIWAACIFLLIGLGLTLGGAHAMWQGVTQGSGTKAVMLVCAFGVFGVTMVTFGVRAILRRVTHNEHPPRDQLSES